MHNNSIEICFAIQDLSGCYCKYTCTAMISILCNTRSTIKFHILHDESLSANSMQILRELSGKYNAECAFYPIEACLFNYNDSYIRRFSVASLFRLKVADILPHEVKKLIYLDSDIIVNMDIKELWETDLDFCLVGGCVDLTDVPKTICTLGILDCKKYINSGVLVFDLEHIRNSFDMFEECISFLDMYPDIRHKDQDAINYVFRNKIKYLDKKYNVPSVSSRKNEYKEEKAIFHFLGDCPKDILTYGVDRLFYYYFRKTLWGETGLIIDHYRSRLSQKEVQKKNIISLYEKRLTGTIKKTVFWGVSGAIHDDIMNYFVLSEDDYFIDSNDDLWNTEHMGRIVYSPQTVKGEKRGEIIIIITIFAYSEVKKTLLEMGFVENEDFYNGRDLLPEVETFTVFGDRDCKWDI